MMHISGIVPVMMVVATATLAPTPSTAAVISGEPHRGLSFTSFADPYHSGFFKKDIFDMPGDPTGHNNPSPYIYSTDNDEDEHYPSPSPYHSDDNDGELPVDNDGYRSSDDDGYGYSENDGDSPDKDGDQSSGNDGYQSSDNDGHHSSDNDGYQSSDNDGDHSSNGDGYHPSPSHYSPPHNGRHAYAESKAAALKDFYLSVRGDSNAYADHEGDEGNEGKTGIHAYTGYKGSTTNYAVCHSKASAYAQSAMANAHASVTEHAIKAYCDPAWDGDVKVVYDYALDAGAAIAKAVAATQADCVSKGYAFGCTSASATAEAWAEATAEAHAFAVSKAFDKCHCAVETSSLSVAQASTYIELSADVFSHAEVFACSEGDGSSWAAAYSKCTAVAYAKVWTKAYAEAFIHTGCLSSAAETKVLAATGGDFISIEGCETDDKADGDAYGTTDGSYADAHAAEYHPSDRY